MTVQFRRSLPLTLATSLVARLAGSRADRAEGSRKVWWFRAAGLLCVIGGSVAVLGWPPDAVSGTVAKLTAVLRQSNWVEGRIPAPRGCLLDRNGLPLAWSTRQFAVNWIVPVEGVTAREEFAILTRYLRGGLLLSEADLGLRAGQSVTLKRDLGPSEVAAVARLRAEIAGLTVVSTTVRHQVADQVLRERLGEVQVVDGLEIGVSGEEKQHNARLTGRDGHFRVMTDKHGRWLKESWQKTVDICPGYDVYLPFAVEPSGVASAGR